MGPPAAPDKTLSGFALPPLPTYLSFWERHPDHHHPREGEGGGTSPRQRGQILLVRPRGTSESPRNRIWTPMGYIWGRQSGFLSQERARRGDQLWTDHYASVGDGRGEKGRCKGSCRGHAPYSYFLKRFYLFMRDTHREAETQAEGEAGSLQGARCWTRSGHWDHDPEIVT